MAYLLSVFIVLFAAGALAILYVALAYSSLSGAPFVPSSQKELSNVLREAKLLPNSIFLDLGCGDGRAVIEATQKYGVKGIGVDINPFLISYANFKARKKGIKTARFYRKNLFDTSLANVDVIYLFLMPKLLIKLAPKLMTEGKIGVQIISHGFQLPGMANRLVHVRKTKPFPTYFYRIKKGSGSR